jgi:hypothetical protein
MGDHDRLARTLKRQLQERRAQFAEALVKGGIAAVDTFDEYRFRCGLIDGFDQAIAMCEDIEKAL